MKRLALLARILCAFMFYSLAGCAGIIADHAPRGGSYPLEEHQAAALSKTVSVRYDKFVDSRCPQGALCIWAGKVSYHFTVTSLAGSETFALDYEGHQHAATTLTGVSFGISFAGVRERPAAAHAVVLEVAVKAQ